MNFWRDLGPQTGKKTKSGVPKKHGYLKKRVENHTNTSEKFILQYMKNVGQDLTIVKKLQENCTNF